MKHSEILDKVECLIGKPLEIVVVDKIGVVEHQNATEKLGGKTLPVGEYAIVELRLLVPLSGD